ncbi:fasciclin domain-containing protein [Salinibacter altiplanensis]|uniref:fasciclin domain-containing protein n=1 Tax=Salinibacter altiplanensis TaxID=1803181 RepID=UPI00131A51C6|nr:fasciclin domain-containing protein [Salinibacter altiplanensis]
MIDVATSLRRWGRLGLGLLAFALVTTGCDAFIDQDLDDSNPQTPSVTEIVTEVPALSRLEEGLQKTNLVDDLQTDGGSFTVIAPTDGAFAPIGEGELSQSALLKTVLSGHVIPGEEIVFEDLENSASVQTLAGEQITLGADGSINGTDLSIENRDVNATNGVVHVVDGVFAGAVNRILITADYTILGELVQREGLESALRADGRTMFAPSNDAFLMAFDDDDNGKVDDDELQGTDVADVLQEHVHDGVFSAADFLDDDEDAFPKSTTLEMLSGRNITIATDEDGDSVFVNPDDENAEVTTPDVKTRNGRIHGIDTVLLP